MAELSRTPVEKARKAHSAVLQALQDPGTQRTVAQVLGVSESTVSRIKTEKLEDAITLLYQLGFKVVSAEMQCFPRDYVTSLHHMARMQLETGLRLEWD